MRNIITVDGTAGVGKGTLCTRLARDYGCAYLDSGAFYRVLGWQAQQQGRIDAEALLSFAHKMQIEMRLEYEAFVVYCNGVRLEEALRNEEIASWTSKIAIIPELRQALLQRFRDFALPQHLVADGRDMGTVVFPAAALKIYLTASAEIRAERRYKQLKKQGEIANMAALVQAIAERDKRDAERQHAPLKPASDAVVIDTSHASIDEVYQQVKSLVEALPSSFF